MNRLILLLILFFSLSACVSSKKISSASNQLSTLSNKVVNLVNKDEAKKISNNEKFVRSDKNKNKMNIKSFTVKFVEWTCKTYFMSTPVLNVGYFPKFKSDEISFGALTLENNEEVYPAFHMIHGINNKFTWGGKKLDKYMIVIKPTNTGYYYDFSNAKKGEIRDSKQTLSCMQNTYFLKKENIQNFVISFKTLIDTHGFNLEM